jgi:hypothetical protein
MQVARQVLLPLAPTFLLRFRAMDFLGRLAVVDRLHALVHLADIDLQELRRSQAEGLAAFAAMTALAVSAYKSAQRADGGRVVGTPDGSRCEIVGE